MADTSLATGSTEMQKSEISSYRHRYVGEGIETILDATRLARSYLLRQRYHESSSKVKLLSKYDALRQQKVSGYLIRHGALLKLVEEKAPERGFHGRLTVLLPVPNLHLVSVPRVACFAAAVVICGLLILAPPAKDACDLVKRGFLTCSIDGCPSQ
jgi:hypothetical protein